MPSVTTDRHMLTIQMRKYSPASPVNLSETALPADCGATDEFATSLSLFLSLTADAERAASSLKKEGYAPFVSPKLEAVENNSTCTEVVFHAGSVSQQPASIDVRPLGLKEFGVRSKLE